MRIRTQEEIKFKKILILSFLIPSDFLRLKGWLNWLLIFLHPFLISVLQFFLFILYSPDPDPMEPKADLNPDPHLSICESKALQEESVGLKSH